MFEGPIVGLRRGKNFQGSCGDAENCPSSSFGQGLDVVEVEDDMDRCVWSVLRPMVSGAMSISLVARIIKHARTVQNVRKQLCTGL